jgi:K+-transporting ATPase KdpF subunit
MEVAHGYRRTCARRAAIRLDDRFGRRLRPVGRWKMTWLYILSGIVAVGLLVYLIAALLNPEDFS